MSDRETSMATQAGTGLVFAVACWGAVALCAATLSIWWILLPLAVGAGIGFWPGWSSRPRQDLRRPEGPA